MKPFLAALVLSAVLLSACSRTTQTTSGDAYLSQYRSVPVPAPVRQTKLADGTVTEEIKSIEQRIREAAAVEPVLKFPARIGLARVENGYLTVLPMEEADGWNKAAQKLGRSFGEFVPVNPMIAQMAESGSYGQSRSTSTINMIRLGAARQHLDAVLVYEVITKESEHRNILAAANTTILGGYILPSERHDAEGLGNALLIDVIQGYPYGTLSTVVETKSRSASAWGWGSKPGDKVELTRKVKAQAAQQLADESVDLFTDLRLQLAERGQPMKLTRN
ncbi:MAG: hypothetical protein ACAH80_08975 [Alphaproteobacteria bacterium]